MKNALQLGGIGLLALSAILLTTGLIQFIIPPTFESVVRIYLPNPATNNFDAYWLQTEMEKLQSRMVLYQVITNLDLNRKWGKKFKEGQLPTELTYKLLKSQLEVSQHRSTTIFEIHVRNEDPTEAAIVANEIAKAYRDQRISREKEIQTAGEKEKIEFAIIKDYPVEILDPAEPNLRPVRPHPLIKILVPAAGLIAGVLGVVLLMLAVMRKDGDTKSPPLPMSA